MKINFLGDSITEGACASKVENTYVYLVGKMLGCETRNYGISGTRIARQIGPELDPNSRYGLYFSSRVSGMKNDADYVFVFGGTNDFGHGDAPFGKEDDNTPDTYLGAVNYLIDELLKYYKKEQIIFILPFRRIGEDNPLGEGNKLTPGKTLKEYIEGQRKIVEKRGIKYLDFRNVFGDPNNNPLLFDGLHPNDKGHLLLATLLVDYIKTL